jgi:hypothetical protein
MNMFGGGEDASARLIRLVDDSPEPEVREIVRRLGEKRGHG